MDPKLAANIRAYRTPEAVQRYTSHYGFYPVEKALVETHFAPLSRVLDLACGGGRTTIPLHERGHRVVGLDLSGPLIAAARRRFPYIDFQVGSYCDLPFQDGSFDAILISHNGLDYAYPETDRGRTLRECARVLRDGGKLVFSSHNVKSLHFSPYYFRPRQRAAWLLRHAPLAFRAAAYVRDLNSQWTFFGSWKHVSREASAAGFQVVDMVGFRLSRSRWFNTFISPWIHYVCVRS
ncbi:MAG: class I SAM-dependent methyltransferase [Acidobacteriota bacterium]